MLNLCNAPLIFLVTFMDLQMHKIGCRCGNYGHFSKSSHIHMSPKDMQQLNMSINKHISQSMNAQSIEI